MTSSSMPRTESVSLPALRAVRADALVALAIIVIAWTIYALISVTTSPDSAWTFHLAASMLRQHNIDLDEYRSLMHLKTDYRMRVVGGHIYSYYPIATPLLVTPAVWLINKIYPVVYPTDFYGYLQTHAPDGRTAKIEKVLASGFGALAAILLYLIARRELPAARSMLATGIFAFSTSMWSTATRALWQHGPSALFIALALYLLFRAKEQPAWLLPVGAILGYSYLIRPTNSLAVALIGLYLLLNFPKQIWLYILGAAAVIMPYLVQNWITYGNLFPPYSYQLFQRLATPAEFREALAGLLVSPA